MMNLNIDQLSQVHGGQLPGQPAIDPIEAARATGQGAQTGAPIGEALGRAAGSVTPAGPAIGGAVGRVGGAVVGGAVGLGNNLYNQAQRWNPFR
jgi:hypothetical protein